MATEGVAGKSHDSMVYYGMPFEEYCELPGINASALKGVGGCSPLHLKAYLDGDLPSNDTPDKRLGRAIHSMLLEPHLFDKAFPTADQCWADIETTTKGVTTKKRCKNQGYYRNRDLWYCGVHGKDWPEVMDYVTAEERLRMAALEATIKRDPSMDLLRPGKSEVVIQWSYLGLTLKTRIDRVTDDVNHIPIVDIKKCRVGYGTDEMCQKECGDRGYHIQAWFHRAAVKAAFGDRDVTQHFLFVEDSFPFCTNALQVDDDDIKIAEFEVNNALSRFNRCKETGHYFGYQMVINPEKSGVLNAWYKKPFEELLAPSEMKVNTGNKQ